MRGGRKPMTARYVFGDPPQALAPALESAVQISPARPGAALLEEVPDASASEIVMAAPPGTIERRFWLAHALRALAPGGALTAMAPNAKGGTRLLAELEAFGCAAQSRSKAHHRIVFSERPAALIGVADAIEAGAARFSPELEAWTQPGVFAWDRVDAGSAALIAALDHVEPLSGAGADFGCGLGVLAKAALRSPKVTRIDLIDADRRAIECAQRNVNDPRARFSWSDIRDASSGEFDFVIMNPPFHDGGAEDRALGLAFVRAAVAALTKGGRLLMVANRHLPYEHSVREAFRPGSTFTDAGAYKIIEARR
jgi:16S rRNA (guanine1207-N2)-methyltransferase